MPRLNPWQFAADEVDYTTYHDPMGEHTTYAEHQGHPIGSVNVKAPQFEEHTDLSGYMKDGEDAHHWQTEEALPPDSQGRRASQQRWGGGAFEPMQVTWAGVVDQHRRGAVGRTMLGVAVRSLGGVPMADASLSPDGARLSRHMAKQLGQQVTAHPDNPEMEANTFVNPSGSAYAASEAKRESIYYPSKRKLGHDDVLAAQRIVRRNRQPAGKVTPVEQPGLF